MEIVRSNRFSGSVIRRGLALLGRLGQLFSRTALMVMMAWVLLGGIVLIVIGGVKGIISIGRIIGGAAARLGGPGKRT
jgi:hypothetical protein